MAEDIKKMPVGAGLPEMPEEIVLRPKRWPSTGSA